MFTLGSVLLVGAVLVGAVLLDAALAPPTRAQEERAEGGSWRLHAVEFARSEGVPARRLLDGADAEPMGMSWYFFVARRARVDGSERVVLVDVGTDRLAEPRGRGERRSWHVRRAVPVLEALARLGLGAEDVTDVVLTHHHWDHVGALARYPDATVHAHPAEWARVPDALRRPVERAGRASLRRAGGALWPGFAVRNSGAHTAHQRMVRVECADGPVIVASDAAYLYRNLEEHRAVAVATSAAANLRALDRAVADVGADRVIPGHDPAVFTRYRSELEGVAAICP